MRMLFAATACVVVIASARLAASAAGFGGLQTGDLHITTDATDYNINTGDFTMPHHVSASRPGTQIDGDHAHGNGKHRIVTIVGHVVVHQTGNAGGGGLLASSDGAPSTLTTDRLGVDLTTKMYTADGNVRFEQGTRTVTAAHGVLNDLTHDLHLTGNVHIEDAEQVLEAQTVDYNTLTENVHATDNVRISVPIATPLPGAIPAHTAPPASPHGRRHL